MTKRIWELDALRGICILGMIVVHLIFDLVDLMDAVKWTYPSALVWLMDWGGTLFFLISGICATLGSRNLRRGLIVFFCGMVCTAVTAAMAAAGIAGSGIVIRFGVLHCLGLCMILWQPVKGCSPWFLALMGAVFVLAGLYFDSIRVNASFLFPLGLRDPGFHSADYFPLLPFGGFFLLGGALGKTLYGQKITLLPRVDTGCAVIRFLIGCGRHSLIIYLLHQPILMGIFALLRVLLKS